MKFVKDNNPKAEPPARMSWGFCVDNLEKMRKFYSVLKIPKYFHGNLRWSHYLEENKNIP